MREGGGWEQPYQRLAFPESLPQASCPSHAALRTRAAPLASLPCPSLPPAPPRSSTPGSYAPLLLPPPSLSFSNPPAPTHLPRPTHPPPSPAGERALHVDARSAARGSALRAARHSRLWRPGDGRARERGQGHRRPRLLQPHTDAQAGRRGLELRPHLPRRPPRWVSWGGRRHGGQGQWWWRADAYHRIFRRLLLSYLPIERQPARRRRNRACAQPPTLRRRAFANDAISMSKRCAPRSPMIGHRESITVFYIK